MNEKFEMITSVNTLDRKHARMIRVMFARRAAFMKIKGKAPAIAYALNSIVPGIDFTGSLKSDMADWFGMGDYSLNTVTVAEIEVRIKYHSNQLRKGKRS